MRLRTIVPALLLAAALAAWFALLRPVPLGGSTTFLWVSGTSMQPTLRSGDLVALRRADHYDVGQIVAYRVPKGDPGAGSLVIHRIVGGDPAHGFVMRGDNRDHVDDWRPALEDVAGGLWFSIPSAGGYLAHLHDPVVLAPMAAGVTVALILLGGSVKRNTKEERRTEVEA